MNETLQPEPTDDGEPPSPNFYNYDEVAERRPWGMTPDDPDDIFGYMNLVLKFSRKQHPDDIATDTAALSLVRVRRAQLEREAMGSRSVPAPTPERRLSFAQKILFRLTHGQEIRGA